MGKVTVSDPPVLDRFPVELPLLRPLFEALGVGVWATDRDGLVTAVSPHAEQLFGYPEAALRGQCLHDLLHRRPNGSAMPIGECPILAALREARPAEGTDETFQRADGTLVAVTWGSAPIVLAGELTGSLIACYDAARQSTDQAEIRRELTAARLAGERLALLAEAGSLMAEEVDVDERLRRLARLVVPALGDWSVVDLLQPPAGVRRAAAAHRHFDLGAELGTEADLPAPDRDSPALLARALHGSAALLVDDLSARPAGRDPLARAERDLFDRLGAGSAVVAPLRVRGRVLGALTVVRWATQAYSRDEVALVQDLARRAALAVDNARAYALQRHAAETLQRSLLTDPPDVAGVRMAARYLPAMVETRLGGDWYDAFCLPGGALALAIGDVAGHDTPAAAAMAQVRTLLRAHAIDGAEPGQVLERLDESLRTFAVAELVTAAYAMLTPAGGVWRLIWSNAGHPPPLLVRPDGEVSLLESPVDLPLGVEPTLRRDGERGVAPGSILLLYTDGLVERRDRPITTGLAQLVRLVGQRHREPKELLDAVLAELAEQPEDDVAVLAVQLLAPPAP